MATIKRQVMVEIEESEMLFFLSRALYERARAAKGKRLTFYVALGHLVGITDKEAVKGANDKATKENHITVTEFRRWLPEVVSRFAADVLLEEK